MVYRQTEALTIDVSTASTAGEGLVMGGGGPLMGGGGPLMGGRGVLMGVGALLITAADG